MNDSTLHRPLRRRSWIVRGVDAEPLLPEQLEPRAFLSATLLPTFVSSAPVSSSTVALVPLAAGSTLRTPALSPAPVSDASSLRLVEPGPDAPSPTASDAPAQPEGSAGSSAAASRWHVIHLTAAPGWGIDLLILSATSKNFHAPAYMTSRPSADGYTVYTQPVLGAKTVSYTIVLAPDAGNFPDLHIALQPER